MTNYTTEYALAELVYLVTDVDQHPRMIVGVVIHPTGMSYELAFGDSSSGHCEIEITREPNIIKRLT